MTVPTLFLLRAWVRYHGWRNAYWREDAIASRCPHDDLYFDEIGALCVSCGAGYWPWQDANETGSSNTTAYVRLRLLAGFEDLAGHLGIDRFTGPDTPEPPACSICHRTRSCLAT